MKCKTLEALRAGDKQRDKQRATNLISEIRTGKAGQQVISQAKQFLEEKGIKNNRSIEEQLRNYFKIEEIGEKTLGDLRAGNKQRASGLISEIQRGKAGQQLISQAEQFLKEKGIKNNKPIEEQLRDYFKIEKCGEYGGKALEALRAGNKQRAVELISTIQRGKAGQQVISQAKQFLKEKGIKNNKPTEEQLRDYFKIEERGEYGEKALKAFRAGNKQRAFGLISEIQRGKASQQVISQAEQFLKEKGIKNNKPIEEQLRNYFKIEKTGEKTIEALRAGNKQRVRTLISEIRTGKAGQQLISQAKQFLKEKGMKNGSLEGRLRKYFGIKRRKGQRKNEIQKRR